MSKYLFGIQPTGRIHLGNYLGGLKKAIELQENNEVEFLIANLHALTAKTNDEISENISILKEELKKLGVKTVKIQENQETRLAWEIMCSTPVAEMERMTQWKDKGKGNVGLLTYPCLMAADIILSNPDYVIVGEDQTQHMEFYRKTCKRLNIKQAQTLQTESPRIMSLTNPLKKMSKSEEKGCLFMFDNNSKKIKKAVTTEEGRKNLENICKALGGEIKEGNKELKDEIIKHI